MDAKRFDHLAKLVAGLASRRTLVQGAAAGGLASALGLVGAGVIPGFGDEAEAGKRGKRRRRRKKKKQRRREKKRKQECRKTCSSNDPCIKASCNKKGRCKSRPSDNIGESCEANDQCCSGVCTCGANDAAGQCQGDFFQDFEVDIAGWEDVTRVASGTDGIPARSGGFYAQVPNGDDGFTQWGGYSNVFPQGGYTTETAIYLDIENAPDVDTRFDYSSAVSTPECTHRRDFVFNAGVNLVGGTPTYCVSASNDGAGWPCNPGRDPVELTETGWYLFRHDFYDAGEGVLAVDLVLLDPQGDEVHTWTLSDATDIIGETVGGNRYGWFVRNQFPFLAIDDTNRTS